MSHTAYQRRQSVALFIVTLLLPFALLAMFAGTALAQNESAPTFVDFSGVNEGDPADTQNGAVLGWERHDVFWSVAEPVQGQWQNEYLVNWGSKLMALKASGVNVLPVLDYNAPWSMDRTARTWQFGGERWHVEPRPDGQFDETHFVHQADNTWKQNESQIWTVNDKWPLASEHVKDWQNYVRRVVSFLRKPPYNVEYFQIWNEAHPASGFWAGDMGDYMNRVHLPAAKIIHDLGGKVVYGGWPCCGSLPDLTTLLDQNHAWSSIDVLDIHYFPVSAYEVLRKAANARGCGKLGIWQTEIGFTKDPGYIANTYPRILSWALSSGWAYPNQYKAFYFANWSPDDPKSFGYDRCLNTGAKLSWHGSSLQTIGTLLGGGTIAAQPGVTVSPALIAKLDEKLSSQEAFRVGKRVVIAIHVTESDVSRGMFALRASDGPTITIDVPFALSSIKGAERVDIAGQTAPAIMSAAGKRTTSLQVPVSDAPGTAAASYLENAVIRTFYVTVSLK